MSISYLVNIEQLSVLAHFCGINAFPGLPQLPAVNAKHSNTIIKTLDQQGMLNKQGEEASVDIVLSFILANMASPSLLIQTPEDMLGYCSPELGVVVSQDKRSISKYRITPLPDASSLARKLWENRPKSQKSQKVEFTVQTVNNTDIMQMTIDELVAAISQIYTEAKK